MKIQYKILKLKRIQIVIAITFFAVVMANLMNFLIGYFFDHIFDLNNFTRSTLIPLFIAPFISWYFIGLLIEIDKIKEKMVILASNDDLTGVFNRRMFYESCRAKHEACKAEMKNYSMIMIDIDNFKQINDKHRHDTGDYVLKSFSVIAKKLTKKNDLLGRIGGDEFAFFLNDTDLGQAIKAAKQLLLEVEESEVNYRNKKIDYTISIGITENTGCLEQSFASACNKAEKALTESLDFGGDRISIQ